MRTPRRSLPPLPERFACSPRAVSSALVAAAIASAADLALASCSVTTVANSFSSFSAAANLGRMRCGSLLRRLNTLIYLGQFRALLRRLEPAFQCFQRLRIGRHFAPRCQHVSFGILHRNFRKRDLRQRRIDRCLQTSKCLGGWRDGHSFFLNRLGRRGNFSRQLIGSGDDFLRRRPTIPCLREAAWQPLAPRQPPVRPARPRPFSPATEPWRRRPLSRLLPLSSLPRHTAFRAASSSAAAGNIAASFSCHASAAAVYASADALDTLFQRGTLLLQFGCLLRRLHRQRQQLGRQIERTLIRPAQRNLAQKARTSKFIAAN